MKTDLKRLHDAYANFFVKSEEGQFLMSKIEELIENNRRSAEDHNDLMYLNKAKGNREVLELIENVLKTKKGER